MPLTPGFTIFGQLLEPWISVETFFFSAASAFAENQRYMQQATGMSSSCQVWSLGFLVRLKPIVHLFREDLHSCYMPTCGLTDYDPVMGTTHDLCIHFGAESL